MLGRPLQHCHSSLVLFLNLHLDLRSSYSVPGSGGYIRFSPWQKGAQMSNRENKTGICSCCARPAYSEIEDGRYLEEGVGCWGR